MLLFLSFTKYCTSRYNCAILIFHFNQTFCCWSQSSICIHVVILTGFHFIVLNYANYPKNCLNNENCYKLFLFLRIKERIQTFFLKIFLFWVPRWKLYLYKSWIVDQIFYFISRRNKYWRACRQTLLKLNMIELTVFDLLTLRNIFFIIHICI